MRELKNEELKEINGGLAFELTVAKVALIGIGIPFAVGIFDGFFRPLKCRF